jgi:hypothetical protein
MEKEGDGEGGRRRKEEEGRDKESLRPERPLMGEGQVDNGTSET